MNQVPKVTSRFSIEDLHGKSIEMNLHDADLTVTGVQQLECEVHPDGDGLRITIRGKHSITTTDELTDLTWPSANLPQRFVDLIRIHPRPEVADYVLAT